MNKTWYLVKVKTLDEVDGVLKNVTKPLLIEAVSYTHAETRVNEIMLLEGCTFSVTSISKTNISEVIDGSIPMQLGYWYKAKISFISIDDNAGKEVKISEYILINEDDLLNASFLLEKYLERYNSIATIDSITQTKIHEVYPDEDGK